MHASHPSSTKWNLKMHTKTRMHRVASREKTYNANTHQHERNCPGSKICEHLCDFSHPSTMVRRVAPEGASSLWRARPKRMMRRRGKQPDPCWRTKSLQQARTHRHRQGRIEDLHHCYKQKVKRANALLACRLGMLHKNWIN